MGVRFAGASLLRWFDRSFLSLATDDIWDLPSLLSRLEDEDLAGFARTVGGDGLVRA